MSIFFKENRNEQIKEIENKVIKQLKQEGVPESNIKKIIRAFKDKIKSVPEPRIALIGGTGVGKSTTLNSLFNAGRPTSDIRACTQEEAQITGKVEKYTGSKGSIIVYDMPGLGEDMNADKKHYATYLKVIPQVDVVIWTFHTGDRQMTPMQMALKSLIADLGSGLQKKLMFAINKVDAIAPGENAWNYRVNVPSPEQKKNIAELEEYVLEKIRQIIPNWKGNLVSYSAKQRYNLEELMTAMIDTIAKDRRWVMNEVADVADYSEMIDPCVLKYIQSKA